jgi:hypothetical protein
VRLLAPFDPVVWDRRRFELLWGWTYKFEAYTPAPKRQFGYYALPLLWHDQVIGWANVTAPGGRLKPAFGYVDKKPRDAAFRAALDDELHRMTQFPLGPLSVAHAASIISPLSQPPDTGLPAVFEGTKTAPDRRHAVGTTGCHPRRQNTHNTSRSPARAQRPVAFAPHHTEPRSHGTPAACRSHSPSLDAGHRRSCT